MAKREGELLSNRKALFNYEILETFEAGIVLTGSEVKSLKNHGGSLLEAYVIVKDPTTAMLRNLSIPPYQTKDPYPVEEKRDRKLLLHKREIVQIQKILQDKGTTAIPLAIFQKRGMIKVRVACARGKRKFDKRSAIKERDQRRAMDRAMKGGD